MTAVLLAALVAPAQPPAPPLPDVQPARAKAIKYLKEKQKDGHWDGQILNGLTDMKGGVTALVTLSLLEAGVAADDPAVKTAVAYLVALKPEKTYVVGLQTQVLARADAKKHRPQIQTNADWLLGKAARTDGKLDGWSYPMTGVTGMADGSNTHFAVMGLHAAASAGAKVDAKVWRDIQEMYARDRREKGWAYMPRNAVGTTAPSPTMTASALLGLAVAAKHHQAPAIDAGPDFEKGMRVFVLEGGRGLGTKSEGYLLFTTAELGRALGKTTFESQKREFAWYREGAEKLVKEQQPDGSWKVARSVAVDADPLYATACGLFFLGPPAKK